MYYHNQVYNIILHKNKDALVGNRPFSIREWYQNGILPIQDLLTTTGQLMSYQDLNNYHCKKTNFRSSILSSHWCHPETPVNYSKK